MVEKTETLILGARGMLGSELCNVFPSSVKWDMQELDITDEKAVKEKITALKPKLIINAAAYTDVDGAEKDEEIAFKVNAHAVGYIAKACKKIKAELVHFSTDYVFDGTEKGYDEKTVKNPINVYGKSKSFGEEFLFQILNKYYLIRTSWLFGKNGKNFVDTILKLAKEKKEISIVNDQIGSPTYAKDLAFKVKEVITKPRGIYHVTNNGTCSWFEFAQEIVKIKGIDVKVNPITSEQWEKSHQETVKRPRCSILLNTKLLKMRHWKNALEEYLKEK